MTYIAATVFDGHLPGDVVNTKGWDVQALAGELAIGRLLRRDGDRVYRMPAISVRCLDCGAPFVDHGALDAHQAVTHRGEPGKAPPELWEEVTLRLTDADLDAVLEGESCPICGRTASLEHMAEKHPHAVYPDGARAAA